MRRKAFFTTLCCLFLIPSVCPASTAAQEDQIGDNPDYSYGEVMTVTGQGLDVLEYDYEMDEEKVVNYSVRPDTVLTNFPALTKLAKGDTVEVYFTDSNGNRVAQTIIKDNTGSVEDEAPSPDAGSSAALVE